MVLSYHEVPGTRDAAGSQTAKSAVPWRLGPQESTDQPDPRGWNACSLPVGRGALPPASDLQPLLAKALRAGEAVFKHLPLPLLLL